MRTTILSIIAFVTISATAMAQDHGSVMYKGQTIPLTGYRTRVSEGKRWIIAEGKKDGKLYSVTVTLKPDVTAGGNVKTDATHTVTLTISNADYSKAENFCFDGGSMVFVTPQKTNFMASGQDMQPGNCFGKSGSGDKLSFNMKP